MKSHSVTGSSSPLPRHSSSGSSVDQAASPEGIGDVFHIVDINGKRKAQLGVIVKSDDGRSRRVLLDSTLLMQGHYGELTKVVHDSSLRCYASPKGLRELALALLAASTKPMYVAASEGYHRVQSDELVEFFAWRNRPYGFGPKPRLKVAVQCHDVPPPASCTPDQWNEHLGRHLFANTYPLVAFCFAALALIASWLNLPRLSVMFVGPSSHGKSTVQQVVQSMIEPGAEIQSASGTTKGIRAYLESAVDRVVLMEDLRQADDNAAVVDLLFDLGNGARRLTSGADQQSKKSAPLRCVLILSNESSLTEMLSSKRVLLNEGLAARFIEIDVSNGVGVFQNMPDGMSAKNFAEQLKVDASRYYGAFWDGWVREVSLSASKIKGWKETKLPEIEREITRGLEISDAVTLRMATGLAAAAFAGWVAGQLKLVPLRREQVVGASRQVLIEHLARRRHRTTPVGDQVISVVRTAIDRESSRFAALEDFHTSTQAGLYGYRRTSAGVTTYLFLPQVFEDLIGSRFGTSMALRQLRAAGFLDADAGGDQKQVRIPSINGGKSERKRFYAVLDAIRFDAD